MFGIKLSKNGKSRTAMVKDSILENSEAMSKKISESAKAAEEKMERVKNYLGDNQDDIRKTSKVSGLALITVAGIGLVAFGIMALMKELD